MYNDICIILRHFLSVTTGGVFFVLLKQLLNEFILEMEIKNYSKRTIKGYRNNNLLLFQYLENQYNIKEVEEVKATHIKRYIKFLQRNKRKATYINGILKCFRAFFKYVTDEEIIEENPMIKVGWLKEGTILINTFSQDEVSRMLNVFNKSDYMSMRNKTIIAFLLDTGVRCLELCNITNEDVTDSYLSIRQGKGKKDRRVALSPYLRKIILRYVRCRDIFFENRRIDKDTSFFMSYRFRALTVEAVERVVKICGEKANVRKEIRCSPHTCRHWFSQQQLLNGLDVYSLSRLLGHCNTTITTRYLQSITDGQIVDSSIKTSPLMNLKKGR